MPKKLLPKRFSEDDIKRWQQCADKEGRSLNNWMEFILNKAAEKVLGAPKKQRGRNNA